MKDAAASVRARLLNHARAERLEFQSVLTRYGVERLLYRLSISPHVDRFVLKGAQLLLVHAAEPHRPTKDLDLLGFGSDDAHDVAQVFREVCAVRAAHDGLTFDAGAVTAEVIRETVRYGGVRVKLTATLKGYPLATVIAEKLESLTQLGLATSRMKDLYDLWYILRTFELRENDVSAAIAKTFHRRGTPVETPPVALTEVFWTDASKRAQWSAFLRRSDLQAPALEAVVRDVAVRLAPMMPS